MTSEVTSAALRQIEDREGRLEPAAVVEAARDPASPLHSHFTWDDSEAARKRRLDEARTLIRSVKLEVTHREVTITTPAYLRDPEAAPDVARYRTVKAIKGDAEVARDALINEIGRVTAAARRARHLAIALGEVAAIDEINEIASGVARRIAQEGIAA
jgi:hypothetical protein